MIFQYVFDKCLWRSAKEKGGGYPPFGFMASSCSVLAAEGTLVAGLNGDGDEHRPREDAYRPKRGEAAEDGEDQRNDRRVDPRLQEEGAKQVVHPGYDQRTPDGKADAGHRGPREPQPNAYRAVPTKGMGATNAAMRPQNAGWGTSAMAKPTPQRNP